MAHCDLAEVTFHVTAVRDQIVALGHNSLNNMRSIETCPWTVRYAGKNVMLRFFRHVCNII